MENCRELVIEMRFIQRSCDLFPGPSWRIHFKFIDPIFPIFTHGFVLASRCWSINFLTRSWSMTFALDSCDLLVPSLIPSISAISLCVYPSTTYILNTVRYPGD